MFWFIHGFLGSEEDWSGFRLGGQTKRLQLPGHGDRVNLRENEYTFNAAVERVGVDMQECGVADHPHTENILCGYSMGGRIALRVALDFPRLVTGLVLISSSPGLREQIDARKKADDLWAQRFATENLKSVLRDWYAQPVFRSLLARQELREDMILRRSGNNGQEIAKALRGMGSGNQDAVWERLRELACPVLLLAGAEDPKFCRIAEEMAGLCPRAEMRIVPGTGHTLHLEAPEVLEAELTNFAGFLRKTQ